MNKRLFIFLLLALIFSACKQSEPMHSTEWDKLVNDFIEDEFKANPTSAVAAGRHEFDGQIGDLSKDAIHAHIVMLNEYRTRAKDFDTLTLDENQGFDRKYLISMIDGSLFWLEKAQAPFKNPVSYFGPLSPDLYTSMEYAPLATRLAALTTYMTNLPRANQQVRENLEGVQMPETFVEMGKLFFGGLVSYFRDEVPGVFSSVKDSILQADFRKANEAAIASLQSMDDWFNQMTPDTTSSYALGKDLYQQMLWDCERVDIPVEQLKEIGERDLRRNLDALKEACNQLAPGKSISECIAMVTSNKPADGPVQAAREQLNGLHQFIIDRHIASIPAKDSCLIAEAPPHQRSNAAYITIPGPYDKGVPSTYYIAPPLPEWSAVERAAYIPSEADLLFITVHEVWPGHFLQFLHAKRAPTLFDQIYTSYAFVEGWAHYAEEMMYNQGYGDHDPEVHIGQLVNALLRNVRFLSSIGLHTGTMTVAQSERMFHEKAFQDPGNARQQASRGTYDPGYLNYTLGKLMIMKLREDWVSEGGSDSTLMRFHDEFLSHGSPPVPLVRALMLKSAHNAVL